MKIEELIAQHLYKNKEVTLQEIGTFKLSPDIIFPDNEEKEFVMPQNAISFEFNAKAGEDINLINYIVQHTNKIKPLAASDLESYIMLSKQLLNIGKPLKIEGVGTLLKTQQESYEFAPANYISPKAAIENVPLKEKLEEQISFRSQAKPTTNNKKIWGMLFFIAIICIALAVWFFGIYKKAPADKEAAALANITDTTQLAQDTVLHNTNNLSTDTTFKVVIKEFPDYTAASNSYSKLSSNGHKLVLYTTDSVTFKIAMPFTKPLSDTNVIKDSLQRYRFGGTAYIEY